MLMLPGMNTQPSISGPDTDPLPLSQSDELESSHLDTSYLSLSQRYSDEGYQTSCIDTSPPDQLTVEQNWDFFQEEHFKHECVLRMFTAVSIIAYTVRRAECNL